MPRITICPRCTSHLGLPADVSPAAQVQCPICEVEFSLATVAPRELPQARIVERVEAEQPGGEPKQLSPQQRLSQLIRASAAQPAAADESVETELTEAYDDAYQDADPELAATQAAPKEELQLGSSRLDQLLSDLIKTPTPTSASQAPSVPASQTESLSLPTATAVESALEQDFEADLEVEETKYHADFDGAEQQREQEEIPVPAFAEASSGDGLPENLRTTPRRKRRPAGLRTLVGVVGGGALGILLGAYGLLWLKGPSGDFLGLTRLLPPSMLPTSATQVADDDSASVDDVNDSLNDSAEQESVLAAVEQPPLEFDSAVAPATAEEPVQNSEADQPVGDLVASAPDTPAPTLADPPAQSQTWPTTPIVGDLRGVKLYSVAQLDELIPAADKAHREFLAGDLSREESWSTMGPAYMTLASLAERYTLIDPAAYGNDLVAKQMAAKEIFRGVVGDPARRADLATVAARWLQHARRLNQGVILVGRVRDLRPQGKWTEYVVDVPLGESAVEASVLLDEVRFSAGDEIAVVGAILPRPGEQLAGFQGDASQRVIAGWAFTPEEFTAPAASADAGQLPFDISAGGQ
jgi:hypothetical protein